MTLLDGRVPRTINRVRPRHAHVSLSPPTTIQVSIRRFLFLFDLYHVWDSFNDIWTCFIKTLSDPLTCTPCRNSLSCSMSVWGELFRTVKKECDSLPRVQNKQRRFWRLMRVWLVRARSVFGESKSISQRGH